MSGPINKKLPHLTKDELTIVLKNATYRGFNVNNLATEIEKNGVDKLRYNIVTNQIGLENADGKLKTKIRLNKIHDEMGIKHSFSLTRFFKMRVFSCCFDQGAYDVRIDRLATELHNKIQEADKKEQAAAKLLSKNDFALMKTILENTPASTMVPLYDKGADAPKEVVWVNFNQTTQSIDITNGSGKSLKFQLGTPVTCSVDGQPTTLDKIPADRADWLMESFKVAIELSSNYKVVNIFDNQKIDISILRSGVEKNPEAHLDKFTDILKANTTTADHPICNVVYLKDDLKPGDGLDNGGLSRDYMNSLFASLVKDSSLSFKTQKGSKLALPVTTQNGGLFPGLTPKELRLLNEIGRVMYFCYNSLPNTDDFKNLAYTTGQHFDELLFEMVRTLKADDVTKNFDDLSVAIKVYMAKRIYEKFLRSDETNSDDSIKDKLALFDLTYRGIGPFDEDDLKGAAELLVRETFKNNDQTRIDLLESFFDEDNYTLKMNGINKNPKAFVALILNGLLDETYGSTTVRELIAPIHAIAQGLKTGCKSDHHWNIMRGVEARAINDKIQGSLDRNAIVAAFEVVTKNKDGSDKPVVEIKELNKKTKWLKSWIKNADTSDEAVRNLLVWMTGCNSLPEGEKLYIQGQVPQVKKNGEIIRKEDGSIYYSPLPGGQTCIKTLFIAPAPSGEDFVVNPVTGEKTKGTNDWTEGAFVEMLNEQLTKGKLVVNKD